MKSAADHYTRDLLGNKPGRPRKPNAKSGAQRQREYRQRQQGQKTISVTRDEKDFCPWCGAEYTRCGGICSIGQLGRKG